MAVYKSRFKGSQVDNAVSIALANKDKGDVETPIYFDSEGIGQPINVSETVTVSSTEPVTSGAVQNGLDEVINYSDIQPMVSTDGYSVVGNVAITDGVASGFNSSSYISLNVALDNIETVEFIIRRVKLVDDTGTRQYKVIFGSSNANNAKIGYLTNQDRQLELFINNSWRYSNAFTLSLGVEYDIRLTWNGTYVLYGKRSDESQWTEVLSYADNSFPLDSNLFLGRNSSNTSEFLSGSLYLYGFEIYVNGKLYYVPYVNTSLPSSQKATKQYIDEEADKKQDKLEAGYGISIDGNMVSVDDSVLLNEDDNESTLKVSHFGDMTSGYNSNMLDTMFKARHSSFCGWQNSGGTDPTKFIKSGNVTITDDGIVGLLDNTRNVLLPVKNSALAGKSWTVTGACIPLRDLNDKKIFAFGAGVEPSFGTVAYGPVENVLRFQFKTGDAEESSGILYITIVLDHIPSERVYFSLSFDSDAKRYTLRAKSDNSSQWQQKDFTPTTTNPQLYLISTSPNSSLAIHAWASGTTWTWGESADLKYYSVTIDGEEVFSGNKKGMDIIKPQDYVVQTTLYAYRQSTNVIYADLSSNPTTLFNADGTLYTGSDWTIVEDTEAGTRTVYYGENAASYNGNYNKLFETAEPLPDTGMKISEDGTLISGGLGTMSRIMTNSADLITQAHNWHLSFKFYFPWNRPEEGALDVHICRFLNDTYQVLYWNKGWNSLVLQAYTYDTGTQIFITIESFVGKVKKGWVQADLYYSDVDGYYFTMTPEGGLPIRSSVSPLTSNFRNISMPFFYTYNANRQAPIDLNSVKLYVDGDLVYQSCLYIPYTLTKDGKKIVDGKYRDRVKDFYDQVGYSNYYTLQSDYWPNYKVIGTPSIDSNFVLSGITSSSYVVSNLPNNPSFGATAPQDIKDMELSVDIITPSTFNDNSNYTVIGQNGTNQTTPQLEAYSNGFWTAIPNAARNAWIAVNTKGEMSIAPNTRYNIGIRLKDGVLSQLVNGIVVKTTDYSDSTAWYGVRLDIGCDTGGGYPWNGSIDLKTLKYYINGQLVYESTIPSQYTLATAEENDIVDYYIDGATSYTERADFQLEQQGTCTANNTVFLPKGFQNADYVLTIPHEDKTPISFVPTESGDWMAEGRNSLKAVTPIPTPQSYYEFMIDQSIENPMNAVTYLGAAAGYTPFRMNLTTGEADYGSWINSFILSSFRPCMLRYDGTVDYYLDPHDYTKKLDGTASDITDTSYEGNVMVEIDPIWIKEVNENGKFRISIANSKRDNNYTCWTHMKKDGTIAPHIYRSAYDGSVVSGKMRSISGLMPNKNTTGTNQIAYAQANGTGWNIDEYSFRRLMSYLLVLLGKSLDTQDVFGWGTISGGEVVQVPSGTADTLGMFSGFSDERHAVKVFGMENLWGNTVKIHNGLIAINGKLMYKMCEGTADGSTTESYNTTGEGYIDSGVTIGGTSDRVIREMTLVPSIGLVPTVLGDGGVYKYYCDYGWFNSTVANGFVRFGCSSGDGFKAGIFALRSDFNTTYSSWWSGCALSYKPQS